MNSLILYFIFILFQLSRLKQNLIKISNFLSDSEIILTIKGKGNQPILNNKTIIFSQLNDGINYKYNDSPSEIFINGKRINKIDFYIYNLESEENNILIKFNKTITNCNVMFYGLSNITKIIFKKFDFSGGNMTGMFYGCTNLISLDLSNIITTSIVRMDFLFCLCSKLIYLDLSNFNTSSVTTMRSIFNSCNSLISLDLSNFNTSSVTKMTYMFKSCTKLISLDLSCFNTSSVTHMDFMFEYCSNLISLDLSNFNTSSIIVMNNMFKNCSKLISLDLSNFIIKSGTNMNNIFNGCNPYLIYCINNYTSKNIISKLESNNYKYSNCSDICFYKYKKIILDTKECVFNCTDNYNFDYNNICYSACPIGTHNISNNICKKDNDKNNIYDKITTNIYNEYNISTYIPLEMDNYIEIYQKDHLNTINNYIEYFNNIIKINNSNNEDNKIINLENELINNNLDIFIENIIIKENKDIIIKEANIIYQLISSDNQKENNDNNISKINLGECENKLRIYYNISNNIALIILKIDKFEEGLLIPIIEYKIYNSKTKEKLNLNICNDIKIKLNIPVILDENNLFKYNSSNEYYNNICFSYTTKNNTDIILKDRQNEFINNKMTLCENNCEYSKYDYNTKKVLCECFVKKELLSENEINKDKLINNFKDIKYILNINIIKCYKEAFNKKGLKNNLGNYIMSTIILFTFILSILFKIKGYNNLKPK